MKAELLLLLLFSSFLFSQEEIELLNKYIKINTKSSTIESVEFFKNIFEKNKIKYKILGELNNLSILAELKGKDSNLKPFLLTHHMDCVNESSSLNFFPNYMEGSCLLDDKALGIAHLIAFLNAKKIKIKRGIYFLAVSGEENGGKKGIGYLIKNGLLPDISFALGEGGKSASATDEKLFLSISTTEKGLLWIEIKIPLPGGHSIGGDDIFLKNSLKKIYNLPSILPYFGKFEEFKEFISWYRNAFPSLRKIPKKIEEVEIVHKKYVYTSLSVTSIETDGEKNKLPTYIKFSLDIRTAAKENHRKVLEFLKKEFPEGEINVLMELFPSPTTPRENIYFKKFLKVLKDIFPSLPMGPSISPGFSDLRYLREKGIPSFGFSPFFLNFYHEATIHKKKERMPKDRFLEGVELMKKVVLKLAEE